MDLFDNETQTAITSTVVLNMGPERLASASGDNDASDGELGSDHGASRRMGSDGQLFISAPSYNTTITIQNYLNVPLEDGTWNVTPQGPPKLFTRIAAQSNKVFTISAQTCWSTPIFVSLKRGFADYIGIQ